MKNQDQLSVTSTNASSVKPDKFTRQGFLGVGSAALATAGMLPTLQAAGQAGRRPEQERPWPNQSCPRFSKSRLDSALCLGLWWNAHFKYPFSFSNNRIYEGGWSHTPPELVMAHLRIDKATFDAIPKDEFVVLPS